jgi:hypothetical protein
MDSPDTISHPVVDFWRQQVERDSFLTWDWSARKEVARLERQMLKITEGDLDAMREYFTAYVQALIDQDSEKSGLMGQIYDWCRNGIDVQHPAKYDLTVRLFDPAPFRDRGTSPDEQGADPYPTLLSMANELMGSDQGDSLLQYNGPLGRYVVTIRRIQDAWTSHIPVHPGCSHYSWVAAHWVADDTFHDKVLDDQGRAMVDFMRHLDKRATAMQHVPMLCLRAAEPLRNVYESVDEAVESVMWSLTPGFGL